VMDDRVKAQADERKRVQSIEDRRAYLIFEMEQKDKWARSKEDVEAKARERAAKGGVEIGNQRGATEMERGRGMLPSSGEFANDRITPEMIADLPPEARRIYEREMGLTPKSDVQEAEDAMTAGQLQGAPGLVRKELTAGFNKAVDTDNLRKKEAAREARDEKKAAAAVAAAALAEDGRNDRQNAQITASDARQSRTIAAAVGRGGGRDDEKPESVTTLRGVMNDIGKDRPKLDDFRGSVQKHADALAAWNKSDQGLQYKELQDEIKKRTTGAPKPVASESTVKDNPSSTGGRKVGATQTVAAGPNKGKTVVWDGKGWTLK
jgi:hypothetical protein